MYLNTCFIPQRNAFFLKIVLVLRKNVMFAKSKCVNMKVRIKFVICVFSLMLMLCSCASHKSSKAMRKAERQMEQVEKRSGKQYKKMKSTHFNHQAPKTKKMMRQDRRHARQMRKHRRTNPYFSQSFSESPLLI